MDNNLDNRSETVTAPEEKKTVKKPARKYKKPVPVVNCDECMHFVFDDEMGFSVCEMDLDEDEMEGFLRGQMRSCPFYEPGDEYKIVRHQM